MAKRKKDEIDVYVEKVSTKEIEGEHDTRDLCAQFSEKELRKKCQAGNLKFTNCASMVKHRIWSVFRSTL